MLVNTKCQVFTPSENVKKMLDVIGYKSNLFGKKVAENSCGDGNVLVQIVERYIIDAIKNHVSLERIKHGLEEDIWAAEIDKGHIINCQNRLNSIAEKYGLEDVSWNIFEGDFLKGNITSRFDFIIGNPPYITYKELDDEIRTFVRKTFETCITGKFDYCYAFIEASLKALKSTGKLAYLVPSNIFKNQFAANLRKYILPHLTDIYDYTSMKLFTGKLTASAIIVCHKDFACKNIRYHDIVDKTNSKIKKISLGDKWVFNIAASSTTEADVVRFGDYFHAASSIATLRNDVYIISACIENSDYVSVGDYQIEKSLLRKAVSPRSLNYNKNEYVIFPYYYSEQGLQRYDENVFEHRFPCATQYLKSHQEELSKRDSDKGIRWYEYGRSQALTHLNQPKLLLSTLATGVVKVSSLDILTIPTSGIYIVPKANQIKHTLETANNILTSKLFLSYVKDIGVISNGNSFRISPRDVNNFMFPSEMLV